MGNSLSALSSSNIEVSPFYFGTFRVHCESRRHLLGSRGTYIIFASVFSFGADFINMPPESCDERFKDTAMALTSHATALRKHRISSDLDEPTDKFFDDITAVTPRTTFIRQILVWKGKVLKTRWEPDVPLFKHKPQKMQKYRNCKLCYEEKNSKAENQCFLRCVRSQPTFHSQV